MTYEEMMDCVIRKYGFEAEVTICFCEWIEKVKAEKDSENSRAMIKTFYDVLM